MSDSVATPAADKAPHPELEGLLNRREQLTAKLESNLDEQAKKRTQGYLDEVTARITALEKPTTKS